MWDAKVVLDSISPAGRRLVTLELTYPRFIHPELLTHRALSRSVASNRAIPVKKVIKAVELNPVIPWFGENQSGMVAGSELPGYKKDEATKVWLEAAAHARESARRLMELGVHKQVANRVLEPFQFVTTIVTATRWAWLFKLRHHPDAQPEFQRLMGLVDTALKASSPAQRTLHVPYLRPEELELDVDTQMRISTARCARISYLNRGEVRTAAEELSLFTRLLEGSGHGHWAPLEHPATALSDPNLLSGNFQGWKQFRKEFANEYVTQEQEDSFLCVDKHPR